jgi:hypothetical protein
MTTVAVTKIVGRHFGQADGLLRASDTSEYDLAPISEKAGAAEAAPF